MAQANELNFLFSVLTFAGIVFLITLGVIVLNQNFQKNLYRQMLKTEELKSIHQHDLLTSIIEAQEEEKKRIAADLHDELGATLSISRMSLVQLERQLSGENLVALQNIRNLSETAIDTIRRISHELMPYQLEMFGLIKTFREVVVKIKDIGDVQLRFNVHDEDQRWPFAVELGLYRICMELINNTLKHAQASQIIIQIDQGDDVLSLTYKDDGNGLQEDYVTKGIGVKNMLARVSALQGTMTIENDALGGRGIVAKILLPVTKTVS
jgi:signal transduction histidine kinase